MSTLNKQFLEACQAFSDREAMRVKTPTGWRIYNYKDLLFYSSKISLWLQAQGFKKQNKAAILLDNSPQWGFIYFGILLAGGVAVPLDAQARPVDINIFLKDAGVSFIFLENKLVLAMKGFLAPFCRAVIVRREKAHNTLISLEDIAAFESPVGQSAFVDVSSTDTASLIYSSGTTADAKGVELSHSNFYANFTGIKELGICNSDDNFISILPLFHAYAFMATFILPLFLGARITYPKTIKSEELLFIVKETQVTIMVGVPELFFHLHKGILENIKRLPLSKKILLKVLTKLAWQLKKKKNINLLKFVYFTLHARFGDSFRFFVSGGAKLDKQIALDFQQFGFDILEGYGLTETAPVVTFGTPGKVKIGSVGKALNGVEIKIVNPNSEGIGEIAIRGANVMKGYYRKEQATQSVFKDGWFYSGDLGYLDEEGYLYISGRIKEVIVLSSGKNIFPEEIEKYYARSDYIKEVGVLLAGQQGSENLRAVVVPDFDFFKKNNQINILEKVRWDIENTSKELPSYKRIMGFVIAKEELPKTRLGKIKRYQLEEIYKKESAQASSLSSGGEKKEENPILKSSIGQKVAQFLRQELALDRDVRLADHLELDLGVDSLKRIELVAGLEKLFRIHFSSDVLFQLSTVADVVAKVNSVIFSDSSAKDLDGTFQFSWKDVLEEGSKEENFSNIDLNPDIFSRSINYAAKIIAWAVFKIFGRLEVKGIEHLPLNGPYLICCNHASFLDAPLIAVALPFDVLMQTYFVGLKEIFEHKALSWAVELARVITIDPAVEWIKAMQVSSFVINRGKIVCLFPEGQRSIDGEIKFFKKGVGVLAKELKLTVVPVAVEGAYQAWPRTAKFPKPHPVTVVFGKPLNFKNPDPSLSQGRLDTYEQIAQKVREEIILLQRQLRG